MVEKDVIVGRFVFDTGGAGSAGVNNYKKDSSAGIAGSVASGMAIFGVIKGILTKMWDVMKKSSPMLQSSLKIINTTLMLMLKPIADMFGMILRPFALMMIKWAIPFYKKTMENLNKPGGLTGGIIGAGVGAIIAAITAVIVASAVGVSAPITTSIIAVVAAIFGAITLGLAGINLGAWITEKVKGIFDSIFSLFSKSQSSTSSSSSKKKSSSSSSSSNWFSDTVSSIYGTGQGLYNNIFGSNSKSSNAAAALDSLQANTGYKGYEKNTALDKWLKPGATLGQGSSYDPYAGTGISDYTRGIIKKKVSDGFISKNGTITQLDPNDNVYAFKGNKMGGGTTINISINALDASSINRDTVSKLAFEIERSMKKNFSGRTAEMFGA